MASGSGNNQKLDIFLFDLPRTRSNLFFRYMATNTQLSTIYHPFAMAQAFGPNRWQKQAKVSDAHREEILHGGPFVTDTIESSQKDYAHRISEVREKGQIAVTNEHIMLVVKPEVFLSIHRHQSFDQPSPKLSNPTFLSDNVFASLQPVFLIRHPVYQIDSLKRVAAVAMKMCATDEDFEVSTSYRTHRWLYDFFNAQGRRPIIVDGDDVVSRTEDVTSKLCAALQGDIDPAGFKQTWDPWPEELRFSDPLRRAFLETIYNSTGIEKREATESPDLNKFYQTWSDAYGEEEAQALKALVEVNMPHYEHLLSLKI